MGETETNPVLGGEDPPGETDDLGSPLDPGPDSVTRGLTVG